MEETIVYVGIAPTAPFGKEFHLADPLKGEMWRVREGVIRDLFDHEVLEGLETHGVGMTLDQEECHRFSTRLKDNLERRYSECHFISGGLEGREEGLGRLFLEQVRDLSQFLVHSGGMEIVCLEDLEDYECPECSSSPVPTAEAG
jgi:hypothetical protein